jgi:hypothetical protein
MKMHPHAKNTRRIASPVRMDAAVPGVNPAVLRKYFGCWIKAIARKLLSGRDLQLCVSVGEIPSVAKEALRVAKEAWYWPVR